MPRDYIAWSIRTAEKRFWSRVNKDGLVVRVELGPCWMWTGETHNGYGKFRIAAKLIYVHRWSYEKHVGPIPESLLVCHKCDVRTCVRPDHLFVGTDADNIHDMWRKGRGSPPPRITGEAHHRARLTSGQVAEIRRRHALGETQRGLSRAFDTSQSVIWRIVHNVFRRTG